MIRIGKVTVKGDNGQSPCHYRAILENGIPVVAMWELVKVKTFSDGVRPVCSVYRRVA